MSTLATVRKGDGAVARCALCGHQGLTCVGRQTRVDLVRSWQVFDVTFSPEALAVLDGREWVELRECRACGFRSFDMALAGNGQFYSELQQQLPSYYAAERPDFAWALKCAKRLGLVRVLDVGCGAGAFLDRARQAGLEASGMEMNPTAAAACRNKGHQVFSNLMSDLLKEPAGEPFDLVTAFQVVEHVPDPVEFVREAGALVRPGGALVISVPNENGVIRLCPFDPHQWPPHHVSRWTRPHLRDLGRRAGLEVLKLDGDRMTGDALEHFWGLHDRLAALAGRPKYAGGRLLFWLLSQVYRKTGCRYFSPAWGPNSFALYRRPARDPGAG